MLASGILMTGSFPSFAHVVNSVNADGLIQIKSDQRIYLYSGAGHFNPYAEQNLLRGLIDILGCDEDQLVIELLKSPTHLPVVLGQNLTHLSFSVMKTNLRAAEVLRKELSLLNPISREVKYIIEPGVSRKTVQIAESLDQEGIIVAVRASDNGPSDI